MGRTSVAWIVLRYTASNRTSGRTRSIAYLSVTRTAGLAPECGCELGGGTELDWRANQASDCVSQRYGDKVNAPPTTGIGTEFVTEINLSVATRPLNELLNTDRRTDWHLVTDLPRNDWRTYVLCSSVVLLLFKLLLNHFLISSDISHLQWSIVPDWVIRSLSSAVAVLYLLYNSTYGCTVRNHHLE